MDFQRSIHGDNERIALENLEFGYRVLRKTIIDFMWRSSLHRPIGSIDHPNTRRGREQPRNA